MADFNEAVQLTLRNEGGYVNNSADPGGATNMGVEQRDLPNTPIQTLTVAQAMAFYQAGYWKPLYNQITSQIVGNKLFDLGVLFGIGEAVKILQQVVGAVPDGNFGPATLAAVNAEGDSLLGAYQAAMIQRAENIVAMRPTESIFLAGWTRRINS